MTLDPEPMLDLTLDNGLRVVIESMPWLPTLSLNLLLPMGSVNDPEDAQGSAAVLHEWLQRGAADRDGRAQADALDAYGVRRGGGCGRDAANLSAAMLAQDAAAVLPLIADMVLAPALAFAEFEGARQLALQELASLDDAPAQRLAEAVVAARYLSPHGRSAYGVASHLEGLDPAALRQSASSRLAPKGAVLALAGGGDRQQLADAVQRSFSAWRGDGPVTPPPSVRPRQRLHVDSDGAQTQVGIIDDAVPIGQPGWVEQALAMSVLAGSMGSRLFTEVRERRGLVYGISSSVRWVDGDAYRLTYASTTPERVAETIEVSLAELLRLQDGVEQEELDRGRALLRSSLIMQGESTGARASRLASDVRSLGRPRSLQEAEAALMAPDLERVNAFLASRPLPQATVVTSGPAPRMAASA